MTEPSKQDAPPVTSEEPPPFEEARDSGLEYEIQFLGARSRLLSFLRLVFFAGILGGLWAIQYGSVGATAIILPSTVAFLGALFRHGQLLDRKRQLENRLLLQLESATRRRHRKGERRPPEAIGSPLPLEEGLRVFAPEVPAHELDSGVVDDLQLLDGPRTLFGFLDASSTFFGAQRLRYWMTHLMTSTHDIDERQAAVEVLADDDRLRQDLLEELVTLRSVDLRAVPRNLRTPTEFASRWGLAAAAHLLGTAAPVLLVAAFFWPASVSFVVLLAVINVGVIGLYFKRSNPARDRLLALGVLLRTLSRIDGLLGSAAPRGREWRVVADVVAEVGPLARRLGRRVQLLEFHSSGIIFEIVNVLVLWELRILPGAERLLAANRELIERAVGALGEIEALLSLSLPLVEQRDFSFPDPLDDEEPTVEIRGMGHPLIEPEVSVRNDVHIGGRERVWIVTGSNMAGKSTYLKAVGTNVVLAGMGGPVCAESCGWTPLALSSDVNVRDSLDDGKSYFQVEVERVRDVVEGARDNPKLLAIFDELFRGTNSIERLALSRAILRWIRSSGALLLVATHDNALTRLVTEDREEGMANYHFREHVEGKTMTFDYRLRAGPARTRNAIRVLEVSDYPEALTEEARRDVERSHVPERDELQPGTRVPSRSDAVDGEKPPAEEGKQSSPIPRVSTPETPESAETKTTKKKKSRTTKKPRKKAAKKKAAKSRKTAKKKSDADAKPEARESVPGAAE